MSLGVDFALQDDNGTPSFASAFAWGARFAILRGVYVAGGVPMIDPTLTTGAGPARAAGLQVGAYLALSWQSDPLAQVATFVAAYGAPQPGDLPPAIDAEAVSVPPAQALAQLDTAVRALQRHYRTVMIYTSVNVWSAQLGNAMSTVCGACPLWLKVSYPWNAGNPPHPESIPPASPVPAAWQATDTAGAWIEQFQGDAIRVPGFRSTVDLNSFLNYQASSVDPRTTWVRTTLNAAGFPTGTTDATLASAIRAFQAAKHLTADGVVGPVTWAALCATAA